MPFFQHLVVVTPLLVSLFAIPCALAAPRNDLVHRQYTSKILEERAAGDVLIGVDTLQARDTSAAPVPISEFTDGQPQATAAATSVQVSVTAQTTPPPESTTVPKSNVVSTVTPATESLPSSASSAVPSIPQYTASVDTIISKTSVAPSSALAQSLPTGSSVPTSQYGAEESITQASMTVIPSVYGTPMPPGTRSSALSVPFGSSIPRYGSSGAPRVTGTNPVPKGQTSAAPTSTDTCEQESATKASEVSDVTKLANPTAVAFTFAQASPLPSGVDTAMLQSAYILQSQAVSQFIAEESTYMSLLTAAVQGGSAVSPSTSSTATTTSINLPTSSGTAISASGGLSGYPSQSTVVSGAESSSTPESSVSFDATAVKSQFAAAPASWVAGSLLMESSTAAITSASTMMVSTIVSGQGSQSQPTPYATSSVVPPGTASATASAY